MNHPQDNPDLHKLMSLIHSAERDQNNPELDQLMQRIRTSAASVVPLQQEAKTQENALPPGLRNALLTDRNIVHGYLDSHKESIDVTWNGSKYSFYRDNGNYSMIKDDAGEQVWIDYDSPESRFLDRVFSQDIPEYVMAALAKNGRKTMVDGRLGAEVALDGRRYVVFEYSGSYANGYLDVYNLETGELEQSNELYEDADVIFLRSLLNILYREDDDGKDDLRQMFE